LRTGRSRKKNDGSCAIVQPGDLPNNIQTTGSFVAANYDSIIMMVVNDECATSGSSGNDVYGTVTARSMNKAPVCPVFRVVGTLCVDSTDPTTKKKTKKRRKKVILHS
jgi:hypothetical protein